MVPRGRLEAYTTVRVPAHVEVDMPGALLGDTGEAVEQWRAARFVLARLDSRIGEFCVRHAGCPYQLRLMSVDAVA
jgi:hypothetical protein